MAGNLVVDTINGVDIAVSPPATQAYANSYDIGVGQTWQDVTDSRVSGTTYTNSTGKPIYIMVGSSAVAGNTGTITVGGVVVLSIVEGGDSNQSFGCIVPNGVVYVVSMASIGKWVELR